MTGELKLYISVVTLSETLYIASRIYQAAGIDNPNGEALNFVEWIKNRAQVVDIDENMAMRAGELKKQLCIALPEIIRKTLQKTLEGYSIKNKKTNITIIENPAI